MRTPWTFRVSGRDVPIAWPPPPRVTGRTELVEHRPSVRKGPETSAIVPLMRSDFASAALARLQEYEGGHEDDRHHGQYPVNVVVGQQGRLLVDSVIGDRESLQMVHPQPMNQIKRGCSRHTRGGGIVESPRLENGERGPKVGLVTLQAAIQ